MTKAPFEGRTRVHARAWFVGERIDFHALERGNALAFAPPVVRAGQSGCAVVFRYGVVVLFELDAAEEAAFLANLQALVSEPFGEPESDDAEIVIEPGHEERIDASGRLQLRDASIERLQVVSHVLAKSAVLAHYEERVAEVFERIEPLAETLRRGGRGRMSSKELLAQIGDALLTQTRTVGRFEVTEKPEITWDRPELDHLYERLVVEYELRERDVALGRKLDLISRSAETLLELVQNRRSLRVEWYIVILIFVELLVILYDIFCV